MNKTLKIFSLIITILLYFSLISCNNGRNENTSDKNSLISKTPQNELFQDPNVKKMFELLDLDTSTKDVDFIEGDYTPYSGDILHVEYQISPATKQVYDLLLSETDTTKLVYRNSIEYLSNESEQNNYNYKSTFIKNDAGEIIRTDSLAEDFYYKYTIIDDSIMIETFRIQTNQNYPRETIYFKKGRSSSEILKSGYLGLYNYYKNAKVIVAK